MKKMAGELNKIIVGDLADMVGVYTWQKLEMDSLINED